MRIEALGVTFLKKQRNMFVDMVANFSVSGSPDISNTVTVGENPCHIIEKIFANITIQ